MMYWQTMDYDSVDWDDQWDVDNDSRDEERWFEEEEESDGVPMVLE